MTRSLPWLVKDKDPGRKHDKRAASAYSPKPGKQDEDGEDLEANNDAQHGHRDRPAKRALYTPGRQLSSSPPSVQPPNPSPLRPGLQADDIYIMVEDEFLAVAQTFTRHLHQAEYQRLQKAARQRDPSSLRPSRPTDGVTCMRGELKRRKLAQGLADKSKKGIDDMLSNTFHDDAGSESDFDVDEMDQDEQPWQGTALQKFMSNKGRDDWQSLTGLQGPHTHTRNAAGFGTSSLVTNPGNANLDVGTGRDEEDTDTDDLDMPMKSKPTGSFSRNRPAPKHQDEARHHLAEPVSTDSSRQRSERLPQSSTPAKGRTSTAVRERLRIVREQGSRQGNDSGSSKSSAEEIPLFLE